MMVFDREGSRALAQERERNLLSESTVSHEIADFFIERDTIEHKRHTECPPEFSSQCR